MKRCFWVDEKSEIYKKYHDEEWGKPKYDDRDLFELLILEGFQAGLSWLTVLKKRNAFKKAYENFNVRIKPELFTRIDEYCNENSLSRSQFLEKAINALSPKQPNGSM